VNLYITSWFSLKNTSTDSRNRASIVIYEGCSFQSTAVQTYLDHVNDSHYSIEPPVRFKPTDDDLLQETSTRYHSDIAWTDLLYKDHFNCKPNTEWEVHISFLDILLLDK